MKILLIGNHSCVNRGDAAIARGLVNALATLMPQAEISMLSRFPDSAGYLMGFPCRADFLFRYYQQISPGPLRRIRQALRSRFTTHLLHATLRWPHIFYRFLPEAIRHELAYIRQFDLVLQVGGSNIVVLYGQVQLDYALATLICGKPLLLLGQSVGPFGTGAFRRICHTVFSRAKVVQLRESHSAKLMEAAALPRQNIQLSTDLAWLVEIPAPIPSALQLSGSKPRVAITLRNLAPFDVQLGVTQQQYLSAFAGLGTALLQAGYSLLLLSTCTGMDRYQNDDRMQALQLQRLLQHHPDVTVEMRELNDIELGQLLAQCELLIGTRLHSAIIAMNAGCPALALNYEHKSAGLMQDMGFAGRGMDLSQLLNGQVTETALRLLQTGREQHQAEIGAAVQQQKQLAMTQLRTALSPWLV